MKKINSFGIVSFKKSPEIQPVLQTLLAWSEEKKITIIFHPFCKDQLPFDAPVARNERELIKKSDALISVGGDGTFLAVAHMAKFSGKPIIGINLGGLGFLADLEPDNMEQNLLKISSGNYITIKRMVLKAYLVRQGKRIATYYALNDIFINRFDLPKLASISAWYGDECITDFQADGLIIATPSGSTAYSLAAGGPIVEPTLRAFILTPICPHSLTERPFILPAQKPIRLKINEKNPVLLLSADGLKSEKLQTDDEIIISYQGDKTNLIQFVEHSYFQSLRIKLCWGQDHLRWRRRNL